MEPRMARAREEKEKTSFGSSLQEKTLLLTVLASSDRAKVNGQRQN